MVRSTPTPTPLVGGMPYLQRPQEPGLVDVHGLVPARLQLQLVLEALPATSMGSLVMFAVPGVGHRRSRSCETTRSAPWGGGPPRNRCF